MHSSFLSEIGGLSNLQSLDLSGTSISSLPAEIGRLSNLQILDLSGTSISSLPSEIGGLSNLQRLDLSGTSISSLPAAIGRLSDLWSLDLSDTSISSLPAAIGRLSDLQSLDLSGTSISSLPAEIGRLSNLQILDLSGTSISSLPSEIGGLSNLQRLDLSGTSISSLPAAIGRLSDLWSLDLSDTSISSLPAAIGRLSDLWSLDLSDTSISSLPAEIGGLSNLQSLDLSGTSISSLPAEIGGLSNLRSLYLGGTSISSLPSELADLKALKRINLSHMMLDEIPAWLFEKGLPFVKEVISFADEGINIFETKLRNQPIEIFERDREFIAAYYAKQAADSIEREAKVIFLGYGNAGKTHTVERLLNECNDISFDPSQTQGIVIKPWHPKLEDGSIRINFWDFGGQEILHSMHRCFLTNRSLYVVVLRDRPNSPYDDFTNQAKYWLENINSFAPNSPVIIALNREKNGFGLNGIRRKQLNDLFGGMIVDVVEYCAKEDERDHFSDIYNAILKQVKALVGTGARIPPSWMLIRRELESLSTRAAKGEKPYIDKNEYYRICGRHGVNDPTEISELLQWFIDLGVCFSYHKENEKELGNYKVLNPEWLTNAVYAIIVIAGNPEHDLSSEGIITKTEIEEILKDPEKYKESMVKPIKYKKSECGYVTDVMKLFRLCYARNKREFFIPALCPVEKPKGFDPDANEYSNKFSFLMKFGFLPNSVVHRLMIDCCEGSFGSTKFYSNGIRIDFSHEDIAIVADMGLTMDTLSIDIYYKNEHADIRSKLRWLRAHIKKICDVMGLRAGEELIRLKQNDKTADIHMPSLYELFLENVNDYPCSGRKGLIRCNIPKLMNALYTDEEIDKAKKVLRDGAYGIGSFADAMALVQSDDYKPSESSDKRFRLAFSVAGEQSDLIEAVCKKLEQSGYLRNEIFFHRYNPEYANGRGGADKLANMYKNEAERVIVVLSQAYLAKKITRDIEWGAISSRIESKRGGEVCLLKYGSFEWPDYLGISSKDITENITDMDAESIASFILNWIAEYAEN